MAGFTVSSLTDYTAKATELLNSGIKSNINKLLVNSNDKDIDDLLIEKKVKLFWQIKIKLDRYLIELKKIANIYRLKEQPW